jgi:hypothetical protein
MAMDVHGEPIFGVAGWAEGVVDVGSYYFKYNDERGKCPHSGR